MSQFKTLDHLAEVAGKRVLVRVDINVPMASGIVTDTTRIERIEPTVSELASRGAKVILLAHFGRPNGEVVAEMSLASVTPVLSQVFGRDVAFASDETANAPRLIIETLGSESGAMLAGTLSLSPNPAVNSVEVSFESPEGRKLVNDIQVYDVIGRLIGTVSAKEVAVDATFLLDVRGLESGIYYIKTYDNSGRPYQKQMVIKK